MKDLEKYRKALRKLEAETQEKATELEVLNREQKKMKIQLGEMGFKNIKQLNSSIEKDEAEYETLTAQLDEGLGPYMES